MTRSEILFIENNTKNVIQTENHIRFKWGRITDFQIQNVKWTSINVLTYIYLLCNTLDSNFFHRDQTSRSKLQSERHFVMKKTRHSRLGKVISLSPNYFGLLPFVPTFVHRTYYTRVTNFHKVKNCVWHLNVVL